MRAAIFTIFGLLRGVPINRLISESSECYSTCQFYFPEEWLPYCLEHYCVDELEGNEENERTSTSTTTSTKITSTTITSTTSSTDGTSSSQVHYYDSSNDPIDNYYASYYHSDFDNYNEFAEYVDYMYQLYGSNSSFDYSDYSSYGSIYESYEWDDIDEWADSDEWDNSHELDDSDDWSSFYDLYEWDSDLSYWVVVSPTPDTGTPPTSTTSTAQPPQSTTASDFYTAFFAAESDNHAQCGISSSLLLETAEDPGSALVAIKDPPTGIQMVEISNVIINGKDVTDPSLFPWMAALRTNSGFHYCGGAIISEWWVLTAAHCEFEKESSVVVTGTLARSNAAGETRTRASAVYNHPKADITPYGTWQYDLTLINLKTALIFSDYIRPICLPTPGQNFVGQACHLAGWGRTDSNPAEYTEQLQQATMRVDSFCGAYQPLLDYDESFCAGYHQDNSGCNGDSGSPLVCRSGDNSFVAAGITSWASGACHGEEPTGYANVAAHVDWIHQVMSDK